MFHVAAREGKLECLKYLCGYEGREEEVLEAIKALDKVCIGCGNTLEYCKTSNVNG